MLIKFVVLGVYLAGIFAVGWWARSRWSASPGKLFSGGPGHWTAGLSGHHGRHKFFGLHGFRGFSVPDIGMVTPFFPWWGGVRNRFHGPDLLDHRPPGPGPGPQFQCGHAAGTGAKRLWQPRGFLAFRPGADRLHHSLPGPATDRRGLRPA